MIDPKVIRQSLDTVAAQLQLRGFTLDTQKFHDLEIKRKTLQKHLQDLQNQRNARSKEVGLAKMQGKPDGQLREGLKTLSDEIKSTEDSFNTLAQDLEILLAQLPNMPHASVPVGTSEADNQLIRDHGTPTKFSFTPKDHVALGERNAGIDFETAAKISGARFVVLRHHFAKMQRALIQFMLDTHTQMHGYTEIAVPYIANAESFFGVGQLPKMKEDLFQIQGAHERYLISTAEVPVTNTVRDQILNKTELPLKFVCYTSCFRSEAGSYGKDMRGMLRQHQFEKVELVQIVPAEISYQVLEELTHHAETILQKLELPYRVMALCTGDIGFAAAKTYDLEVWLPGQNRYREISSCSNFESFQARRMKTRCRDEQGKIDFVHTLNGSALAIGRTMIAIIENYQDELGRIHIPQVLQPYMHGLKVIE